MNTLYESDIDGIHKRIGMILNKDDSNPVIESELQERCDSPILEKQYDKLTPSEMRLCEMEMTKYKMMVAQHEYEQGYKKKASILERELNSTTIVKECATMKEFTKALDNSHSKWMRCSKKLKERYIKEFVYNEMGFPIYKKSSKGPVSSKKRKIRKMETINLNLTDNDTNPGVSINTSCLTHNPIETKNKNQNQSPKQEISDEMMDEIKSLLEKYFENLNNSVYDNPDNIQYDSKNKKITSIIL